MAARASFSYDVFLSFRGEDTRLGFTGNIYSALTQRGIHSFFDDEEIRRGEQITPSLVKAIKESRISIIVLSKNYAFSSFCLKELTTILQCFEEEKKGRVVLPVFYDVDPSDVRHGRESFGEALTFHEEGKFKDCKEKVNEWRMALQQAANLAGFTFKLGDGYEYQFIWKIIKEVSLKINRTILHVAKYPVGLECRVDKVISLLKVGSDDVVHMVGIYGIGGIGKSTVARAVYNSISDHFEGFCCFLEDVRENSLKYGLVHLQEMLLSDILGDKDINLGNSKSKGMSIIEKRLCTKKVLLVLDDVDKEEQLQAIVGARNWFGLGSRIIITTRDHGLLKYLEVERESYKVDELNDKESRELLSWNAFKSDKVDTKYTTILDHAVGYASRLPLALEVIGSNLFGKEEKECRLTLVRYARIPNNKIQDILRVSFDSLEEDEKEVFLDIACCFGGYKLSDVENILHAHHGFSVRPSIGLLIEKSLIKIDNELVTLHELIQSMGREIVRKESKEEPSKRSRLWFYEDVVQVLEENQGTDKIHILILDFPKDEVLLRGPKGEKVNWDGDGFKEMKNLKTLIIRSGQFSKGPIHLPNSLRVLKWEGYRSTSLPCNFYPKKLSILELPKSYLNPCEPIQVFTYLTILDFSYSEFITKIPDVSGVQNLEKLSFKHCDNLTDIHDSVGCLGKLKVLDAASCKNLKTFPPIILTSLEQLNLSHCSILESFPEILGKMENITELHIMGSPIKELPFSIRNLTRLRRLELEFCGMVQLPSSIVMLPELSLMHVSQCEVMWLSKQDKGIEMALESSNMEHLILSCCNLSDDFLPTGLNVFSNLKDLNLSGNNFTTLHAWIKECHFLRNLKLDGCRFLQEIRGIPSKLETFSVKGCTSLECLDLTVLPACTAECCFLKELVLDDCLYLPEITGLPPNLDLLSAKNCTSLTSQSISMSLNQAGVEVGNKMFFMPGKKIPEWFTPRTRGGSMSFWFRKKFPAISLFLLVGPKDKEPVTVKFSPWVLINGNKQSLGSQKVYEFTVATDHILLLMFEDDGDVVFSDNNWNHVEVSYVNHITNNEDSIEQVASYSGIHVYEQTSSPGDILFINPPQTMINVNLDTNSKEGTQQRTTTERHQKDHNKVLSLPILPSVQPPPRPILPVKRPFEDIRGEPSEDEVYPTTIQNDPPVIESCREAGDVELEAVSFCELESEESCSSAEGSDDSDDLFDWVDRKLAGSFQETISSGASSGYASLRSIREAINALELLMVKDLSEVYTDPAAQSELHQLLDLLSTSSHPKVTLEVKEAIAEFKRKSVASFQEFIATVESVNKLENFEKHLVRVQQETVAGKGRRKDLKNSIKKVSLAIKAGNSRKKELEADIETLRKQLATNKRDLDQLVLNIKIQEAKLSTYSASYASLNGEARKLLKEADDLLAANSGIKDEGEAAKVKQNRLNSTWSTDLALQLNKIKNSFGLYD